MRIATSTIYNEQTQSMDNLLAQQQQYGQDLSTGKSLNQPSDNPGQIAQDLSVRATIAVDNQVSTNATSLQNQLTSVDGTLASLTNVLTSVRSLAVQGATDTISASQLQSIGTQVDQQLSEVVGLANSQYNGVYVFSGTRIPPVKPTTPIGTPITAVNVTTNAQALTQEFAGGQSIQTSVTLQQAFNYQASDGSPDVFNALINLRNSLNGLQVVDKSGTAINLPNTVITSAGATPTLLNSANFATPITTDSTGNVSINIASKTDPNGTVLTFNPATATVASVVTAINAASPTTGVTATFDNSQERLVLTSKNGAFQVQNVSSPGATNAGNFVQAFGLQSQADTVNDLSTQIGDIDRILTSLISARATLGSSVQRLTALNAMTQTDIINQTKTQSSIEDTNVAQVTAQFSQTQTALQAAYATTSRLEGKTLFDYLP